MSERAQFILVSFLVLALVSMPTLAQSTAVCPDAVEVDLETSGSWAGHDAFETRTFRLFVPAAGRLLLDVAPLGAAEVEPKLVLLGQDCQRGEEASIRSERRLTSAVVTVDRAGDFYFSVSAQDPASPMSDYVLRNRFAERSSLASKDTADPEDDPNLSVSTITALCRSDDAETGDVFSCAEPLKKNRSVESAIAHRPSDHGLEVDHDVFTFSFAKTRTFEIRTVADLALNVSLYDRHGHRLATAKTADGALRLAGTLGPGRYLLRVAGIETAQGLYGFIFETLDR